MPWSHLSDREVALELARRLRAFRVDPGGAGISQQELARRSGVGLTPLKRFERTGGITLNSLVGILRAMDLLERLEGLVPEPASPSPMELLRASQKKAARRRAPRRKPSAGAPRGKSND